MQVMKNDPLIRNEIISSYFSTVHPEQDNPRILDLFLFDLTAF